MKDITVLSHGYCPDGFSSAWITWLVFKDKADYYGFFPSTKFEDLPDLKGKTVYLIDVVFRESVMKKVFQTAKEVIILDHHISNIRKLKEMAEQSDRCMINLEHSAAYMTWKHFFPKKKIPKIIYYIEDNDMGWWKLPYSLDFITALKVNFSLKLNEKNFKKFSKFLNDKEIKHLIKKGIHYRELINWIVENNLRRAQLRKLDGHTVYLANCNVGKPICDSLANKLAQNPDVDFAAVYSVSKKGNKTVMLRAVKDDVDVSKVAEKYGGGGHQKAAAFKYGGKISSIFKRL